MVFTQARDFVFGASFGLRVRSLRCRVLVCRAADTASLATCFLFGKLFCVATLFNFGEKQCRKNLPLSGTTRMDSSAMPNSKELTTVTDDASLALPDSKIVAAVEHRAAAIRHAMKVAEELGGDVGWRDLLPPCLATRAGLGRIRRSSDVVRFV